MTPPSMRGVSAGYEYERSQLPLPKNGRYPVALLAGGPADIAREVKFRLGSKVGVLARYHMDREHPRAFQRPIPKDVDLVIILRDFIGHPDNWRVKETCRAQGVPVIVTGSKWATMYQALYLRGIRRAELPLQLTETTKLETLAPEPEPAPLALVKPEPQPAPLSIGERNALTVGETIGLKPQPAPTDYEATRAEVLSNPIAAQAAADNARAREETAKRVEAATDAAAVEFRADDAAIALLVIELQRRLRTPGCSITGVMLTRNNVSLEYAEPKQ